MKCLPGQAQSRSLWAGSGWRLRGHTGHKLLHSWAHPPPRASEICQSFLLLLMVLPLDVVRGLLLLVMLLGVGILLHFLER